MRTIVTERRFPPGAATDWHKHEMDYVVVPMTSEKLKPVLKDGTETTAELTAGQSCYRIAGVEHNLLKMGWVVKRNNPNDNY